MQHDFSADQPIRSADEDLLGRAGFASSIASAISGWKGKQSLVIALHGDWGSGKSSLKNLVLSSFAKEKHDSPLTVEFNPWEWAAQDKIGKAFFEQIAVAIGQQHPGETARRLADDFRTYGLYLSASQTLLSGIGSAVPLAIALAALLGLGGIFSDQEQIKAFSALTMLLALCSAAFLRWGARFFIRVSEIAKDQQLRQELSLDQLKVKLATGLQSLSKPLLVVLDDIDRLNANETRLVFQLVKVNADFPNVVYLLLFQRDIVEKRLTTHSQSGRAYLEKIVQIPFDIPKIEHSRLEKILFAGLDRILESNPSVLKRFDSTRWGNMYFGGIRHFFETPRDVYRYLSTLSFYVSLLKGTKAFEVNPIDLMALECLRVFEPGVYQAAASSKNLLTGTGVDRREKDEGKERVDRIVALGHPDRRNAIERILKQVFAPIESLLGGYSYASDSLDGWFKELRACHPDIFPRYFQFSVPADDISQSDLEEIIELSYDRAALTAKLQSLEKRQLLKAALSQLDTYKQDVPIANSDSFVPALMDLADSVEDDFGVLTGLSGHMHLVRIVLWYTKQTDSSDTRGRLLMSAFEKSEGLSLMAHLISGDARRREKNAEKADLLLPDDAVFDAAKSAFVRKIEQLAAVHPGRLMNNLHLVGLLYRWRDWGDIEHIRNWLGRNVDSSESLLIVLDKFASRSTSQGMDDYVARVNYRIRIKDLETFFKLEYIQELAQKLDRNHLNDRQNLVMNALDTAMARRAKGKSDDAWDYDD